ncbi:hypothetical protein PCANC_24817 [Puccinia coronata f. sp. avenae]|uniref:Coiled-coil domain-containing protein 43 n=1 Tax=Puccinia coronata f. sp. avenae TaxID=200324 RepID=A0A2N5TP46_9BASI|nr:hypothetical protein PCANC_24817 [Puccinia coronata f. sp. avenae]
MNKFLAKAIRAVIQSFEGQLDSLSSDESTIEYVADLLADRDITADEKQETIQGILELHLCDPSSRSTGDGPGTDESKLPKTIEESVEDLIHQADLYMSERAGAGEESDSTSRSGSGKSTGSGSSSTRKREMEEEEEEEEDERRKEMARRKALVNVYGKVQTEEASSSSSTTLKQNLRQKSIAADPDDEEGIDKHLLDQELKLLDMKKPQRKKAESKKYSNPDELLLRPNLNTKIVEHEEKLKKQELSSKARLKMEKDRADLNKQKENQLKKKMDARAKAKKLERRA